MEITVHPLFDGVDWRTLPNRKVIFLVFLCRCCSCYILEVAPSGLHLPLFTYTEPKVTTTTGTTGNDPPAQYEESLSQGYPFSVFFQPSSSVSPGLSITRPSPGPVSGNASNSVLRSSLSTNFDSTKSASSFIGFSWGPLADAFPPAVPTSSTNSEHGTEYRPTLIPVPIHDTPAANLLVPAGDGGILSSSRPFADNAPYSYSTPRRPYALSPYHTLQRTSTIKRSNAPRRSVSDREAMKQLVDCVGMSARKKVLESGRKPRVIGLWSLSGKSSMRGEGTGKSTYKKELRFDPLATPIPRPDYSALGPSSETGSVTTTRSHRNNSNDSHSSGDGDQRDNHQRRTTYAYNNFASSEGTNTDSDEDDIGGPPSPSPRPGSAMSTISMSRTPTTTTMLTMSGSMINLTAATGALSSHRAKGNNNSVAGTSNLSIVPSTTSARAMNLDFKLGLPPAATVDGRKKAATASLAIPSTRRHFDPEPHQSQSKTLLPVSLQNGSTLKPTRVDHEEPRGNNNNMSCSTEFQNQWEELEMRHAVMMEDIEDLEERFERLNVPLM